MRHGGGSLLGSRCTVVQAVDCTSSPFCAQLAKSCALAWDCIHSENREPFSNIHKSAVHSSSRLTSEAISIIQVQVVAP